MTEQSVTIQTEQRTRMRNTLMGLIAATTLLGGCALMQADSSPAWAIDEDAAQGDRQVRNDSGGVSSTADVSAQPLSNAARAGAGEAANPTVNAPTVNAPGIEQGIEEKIARDFTHALAQLDGYGPTQTTLRMAEQPMSDVFVKALVASLKASDYAVSGADEIGGQDLVRYRVVAGGSAPDAAHEETYELGIGSVAMRRTYRLDSRGAVQPISPLYVRGADASGISLDASLFEGKRSMEAPDTDPPAVDAPAELMAAAPGTTPAVDPASTMGVSPASDPGVQAHATRTRALPGELIPLDTRTNLELSNDASAVSRTASTGAADAEDNVLARRDRDQNMADLGGSSNFNDVFEGFSNVEERVLVFANDSLELGRRNKRLVAGLIDKFDPDQDIISVVGCSLGQTAVRGGNAALALGRAGRVREALLFAGVDQSRILDEGCWAGERDAAALPTRGVVITLKRARG